MSKTMDQHRATWAWEQTRHIASQGWFSEYVILAKGMPATIMTCGLSQTVALYLAKGKNQHQHLLRNLASWICEGGGYERPDETVSSRKNGDDLMGEITTRNRDRYHMLTDEALVYLVWLKRFGEAAQGEITQEEPDSAPAQTQNG